MTKLFVVGLNLLFFVGIQFYFEGDVTVNQKVPENVKAGETFVVEIEVTKEDREGFAKWQQELPEGFIAKSIETQGATFSFKNQTVKLIWMSIPESEVFSISYEISTDPNIQGNYEINGKFSFIENNERKDVVSEIKTIQIVNEDFVASNDTPTEDTSEKEEMEESSVEEKAPEEPMPETTNVTEEEDNTKNEIVEESPIDQLPKTTDYKLVANKNGIKVERKIEHLEEAKYLVSIRIEKGENNSFGKVEEYLPPDFIATQMEIGQGRFSADQKVMKILWMIMPEDKVLEVSYQLESTSDDLDSAQIHGIFSYLKDDESRQIALKSSTFANTFVAEEIVEDQLTNMETNNEESVEDPVEEISEEESGIENLEFDTVETINEETSDIESSAIEEDIVTEEAIEEAAEEQSTQDLEEAVSNIPSPEHGINYKVQIAAGKKEVKQDYFTKIHGINEEVSIEFHESWYKYTLGLYNVYKDARDKRNEIWNANNKIDDAFVTAYNSGERISVQEALMISKQKWYK